MTRQRDLEDIMAAVSDEETLEAQRAVAIEKGTGAEEVRRLDRLILAAEKREVEAEGEAENQGAV